MEGTLFLLKTDRRYQEFWQLETTQVLVLFEFYRNIIEIMPLTKPAMKKNIFLFLSGNLSPY